jgi:pimeloyl-ACP methyl ester carboxylesterase
MKLSPNPAARESTIVSDGLKLFVREQGNGHPLLMINGIGANSEMWGPAEKILAARSSTIVLDCPGTGRSDTPLFPLTMTALAGTVCRALDKLGYDRVDVLGFSFGGALAQQLARQAPERVRRLALVSTGCGWGSTLGTLDAVSAVAMPLRYYSRSWYELTNRMLGEPETADAGSLEAQAKARFSYMPSLRGYSYQLLALASWSSRSWLGTVETPTLVVSGGLDRLVPAENAVQLARLLPRSRLHLLPGGGHLLMYYRGGSAPRLLADFFSSRSLARSTAWKAGLPVEPESLDEEALSA